MRTAIAAMPATLAPSSVEVWLCQATGGSSEEASSRSRRVTATDSSGEQGSFAGSAELGDHFVGEELHVLKVAHIENLQVDALHARFQERTELVDDLGWCADDR